MDSAKVDMGQEVGQEVDGNTDINLVSQDLIHFLQRRARASLWPLQRRKRKLAPQKKMKKKSFFFSFLLGLILIFIVFWDLIVRDVYFQNE